MLINSFRQFSFFKNIFEDIKNCCREDIFFANTIYNHLIQGVFLAHLSTTYSKGPFRVVRCLLCVSNNFFTYLLLTAGSMWIKLGKNIPLEVLFKNHSQNLIPSKILLAMAKIWNYLTSGKILKLFKYVFLW